PSEEWVLRAERWAECDRKLPAIVRGEAPATDAEEQTILAWVCLRPARRWYAAATRLYSQAFAARPELADDLNESYRYNAVCAAALAGCGQGEDASKLDDQAKARLRQQALEWLKADLALRVKQLSSEKAQERGDARRALRHWQEDPDLAGVRDKEGLAKLAQEEGEAWRSLWAEVEELLAKDSR